MIYVIGSLRNPRIPEISEELRRRLHEDVFDDWFAVGPHADDAWRDYERARGHDLVEALRGRAARHTFEFDLRHLIDASTVVLVLPAGKSAHLELGFAVGKRKTTAVLLDDDPERYDVMYQFADVVANNIPDLVRGLGGR